jgi:hypothetical protein
MKNVGFDFDGVIHKNVTPSDIYGQRHPSIPFNTVPLDKFDKIIDLIKIYKSNDYNIFIITSRLKNNKNLIRKTLDNFSIDKNIIPDDNIVCTGDNGGDKIYMLIKLEINDFYDDSIYHIKSIIKNKNKLKKLKNCFMTIPEKNKIYKII